MKSIFTYPFYEATNYIDPNYIGNTDSGLTRRVDDLLDGTYRTWGNSSSLSQSTSNTIQRMSMYYNAFLEDWNESTIYKFWEQPLIEANFDLVSADLTSADTATPITFTFSDNHKFLQGETVHASNFDSTLIPINGNSYYVKKISDTELQLSTNSGLTELLEYVPVTGETIESATAANPVVITITGYTSSGLNRLTGADGTLGRLNGSDFYIQSIDADTFNLSWDAAGNDLVGFSTTVTNNIDIETLEFPAETITVPDLTYPKLTPTWSSNPNITLPTATADQLSASKISFNLPSLLTPQTVASPNPTALNDYHIKGMSDNGDRYIYSSLTSSDAIMEWTGLSYQESNRFDFSTDYSPTLAYAGRLKSISPDGRWVVFDGSGLNPPHTGHTSIHWKVIDLDVPSTEPEFIESIGSGNVNLPGGPTSLTVDDANSVTIAQANAKNMNIADYDHDGTYTKEGRIYIQLGWDATGSGARPETVAMVSNPYSGNNQNAQLGRSMSMAHTTYPGAAAGHFFATNHADNNNYSTDTRHEYFDIDYSLTAGIASTNHLDTIIQNSGTTLTVTSSYTLNGHEHIVDPKISGNGQRYVIAGTNGFQVYSLSGTTWSLHSEKATNDIKNVEIYEDGLTVVIQTATAIETYTYTSTWTLSSSQTVNDMDYMNGADGGYFFASAKNSLVANTRPKSNAKVYSAKNTSTSSVVYGHHESTGDLVTWYLNQNNSNTYYIKNTTTADEYELYTNQNLTTPINVQPVLSTQFTTAQTRNTTGTFWPTAPTCSIGDSTPLVDSTTGLLYVDTGTQPWRIPTSSPQTVTNGKLTIDASETDPYHWSGTVIYSPGNETYQQRTGESTYANGAIITSNCWERGAGATTSTPANLPTSLTVQQDSSGYITGINDPVGNTGARAASGFNVMLEIETSPDTYTPPTLSQAEQQDVWDTDDEWASDGFAGGLKEWPDHVTPRSAVINYNSPTIVNNSQSGIKYTRSVGHTKWRLEVEYPPMSAEDFQKFHAIAQAAHGQSTPFYFNLKHKDGNPILWKDFYDQTLSTTTPRIKDAITAGDTTMLVEGFSGFEADAFKRGEVFIDGNNENGYLHTSLSGTDSNIFGEAKIRTPWPFRTDATAGEKIYKNPNHATVTLSSDNFEYSVDVNNYYYVNVAFDLDSWK